MKAMNVRDIIAIDVGAPVSSDLIQYGDNVDGWWLIRQKVWLWMSENLTKVIGLFSIQLRLSYMSSQKRKRSLQGQNILNVRPKIDDYGLLEFRKFEDIVKVGYTEDIVGQLWKIKTNLAIGQRHQRAAGHNQNQEDLDRVELNGDAPIE